MIGNPFPGWSIFAGLLELENGSWLCAWIRNCWSFFESSSNTGTSWFW
jgi:hypothetical protein